MNFKRIAVFRMSALGDCVLVSAAVLALRQTFPEARITWIIDSAFQPLFEPMEGVEFIGISKPRSVGDYWALKQQLSGYQFDVLLAMQSSLRANLIYPLIQAKTKIGFDNTRGREGHRFFVNAQIRFKQEHLLDGFLAFVAHLAPNAVLKPEWNLQITQADKSWAAQRLEKGGEHILIVNPAASKKERSCDAAFYVALVQKCQALFSAVVLTGGKADWECQLAAAIEQGSTLEKPIVNLVGKTSLGQLLAVIDRAAVFVSPDTGPIHIADALGKKVVGLYAVARPQLTGPYQNLAHVVDAYPKAVQALCGKQADEVAWSYRVHHPQAMSFVELDKAYEQIEQLS